jgi:hypothetical protein
MKYLTGRVTAEEADTGNTIDLTAFAFVNA